MLEKADYLELHSKFYDKFSSIPLPVDRYLSYEVYSVPCEIAQGPEWFIFFSLSKDFVREILNSINQFMSYLIRLEAWSEVLEDYENENRFNIIVEIIDPLACYIVNYVYAIKNRIAFVASSLLHQTFRLLDPEWHDSDFKEGRFLFPQLYGFLKKYKEYSHLSNNADNLRVFFDQIDNEVFREKTKEFRGRYHHMVPPNIEIGLSGLINRIETKNGRISYGIGGQKPLSLKEILPALHDQHEKCSETFRVFWELFQEILVIWKRERPKNVV
jgi:hypothetical protein